MTPDDRIRCDACPVLCYIKDGMTGACDRYANQGGQLVRVDPMLVLDRTRATNGEAVPFLERAPDWDGDVVGAARGRRVSSFTTPWSRARQEGPGNAST